VSRSTIIGVAGAIVGTILVIAIVIAMIQHRREPPVALSASTQPSGILPGSTPFPKNVQFARPGIQNPPLVAARDAALKPDDEVIGVSVAGRHRAYLIGALSEMSGHVVNDLVGDLPVTVTYCDRSDCSQVFTADARGKALEIGTWGWNGGLLLNLDDQTFEQETGKSMFPSATTIDSLPKLPFVRMKWKDWIALHPDSEVYVGPKSDKPQERQKS
jgi:hypothetical protein